MIYIKLAGGLGNQMFQYSFYEALKKTNRKVKLDYTWYYDNKRIDLFKLSIFKNIKINIPNRRLLVLKKYLSKTRNFLYKLFNRFYIENDNGYDNNVINVNNGIIFGYFQNEKFFENVKKEIIHEFEFSVEDDEILSLANEMKNSNSVSIHIRRGDFLKFPERYGNICDLKYYKKAINYINNRIDNPIYYIFSNDIDWVKNNINCDNARYINISDRYDDWYDMYLMSNCKNNIIANSSFSWWAAYLNKNRNKIIIAPNKWDNLLPNKNSCCADWINV